MISKKSLKVINAIYNYIDKEWVTMEGTFCQDWSDEYRAGFERAYKDVTQANKINFLRVKALLAGLDRGTE